MNQKTVIMCVLLALMILIGAPTSLAKQQYLTNLTEVYGTGSCETCHNNGASDGPRNSYGMLFENQSDHAANASAALIAIGEPESTAITPTASASVTAEVTEETQEETMEETMEETSEEIMEETMEETSEEEMPVTTEAAKSPGFGILASLVGLFALTILAKRKN
ncbi:MAG: hypothetical protein OIN83_03375 [Candidatus Methanoperedens sp.]|nr:hypothetical protein [Candidatus Methanoperedens sp.]